ncbi:MAG: hypothetical protein R3338_09200 [Thermoanaerobaculia bacterium]|nr:hypothetical protein [Thermoanaerobaculia bacterium]
MHYLRIRVTGPLAKPYYDRIDGAVRRSLLSACLRPDEEGISFEVIVSDEELVQLLERLWNIDSMGSRELHMTCEPIRIEPGVDPGSGPRSLTFGLVTCEECQALRCPSRTAEPEMEH